MRRPSSTRLRLAALLGAVALTASLAACGGDDKDSNSSGAQELTILSSFTSGNVTGDTLKKLAAQFTQQTGIKVNIEEAKTDDIANNYEASKLAGKERDLVILNLTPETTDWLPQGQVVDVKQYLDDWGITDKLEPKAIEFWTQGEGVAGFPYWGFNWPMWYNMDLLKKAGITEVPSSFDELIADAKKLREKNIQPLALGGGDWPVQNFITWMAQQYVAPDVAQQVFKDGKYCGNPDVVKGLDLLGKLRDEGVFIDNVQGYSNDQMANAYYQGKAAMMPSGSWAYTQAPAAVAKVTTLGGFPTVSGGHYSKPTAFAGYSNGMFLSPNGEKKIDAVEKFVKFMYDDAAVKIWAGEGSQILDMKPSVVGESKSTIPLVVKGNAVSTDNTDFLVLPDSFIPSGVDYQPEGTAFLAKKGQTGAQFCKKLEKLYKDN